MIHKLSQKLTIALLALVSSAPVFAQRVQPMIFELAPFGREAQTTLRVENTKQEPITIEVVASRLALDVDGNETRTDAEEDFLIFPPQAIVQPGKAQSIRVKYIGDPELAQSQAYRVSVRQVPIDLGEQARSAVGMVVNFNTLANVVPQRSEAQPTVVSITSAAEPQRWNLTLRNDGDRFVRLSETEWTVTDSQGRSQRLEKRQVAQLTDRNLLLPGSELNIQIPAIEGFHAATTQIAIHSP